MKSVVSILAVLFVVASPLAWSPARAAPAQTDAKLSDAELDAQAAQARQRVIEIINQPVTHLPRTDQAGLFSPGWFHDGAIKPDFDTVDVRATQQFPYADHTYVSSDLNPTEMFVASELEFNSMTKYFYTDRSLPKKRLTEAEMLEINSLYRVIGRDEQSRSLRWEWTLGVAFASILAASLVLLFRQTLTRGIDAIRGRKGSPIASPGN
jgi:hypothetical protein